MLDLILGVHLLSAHYPATPDQNNRNLGAYVRLGGATAGVYRNTGRRTSAYAGWTFESGPFALSVGGITGYTARVTPMLIPSLSQSVGPVTLRLFAAPRVQRDGYTILHLAVERQF